MSLDTLDLHNVNLDDNNFDKYDLETIIHSRPIYEADWNIVKQVKKGRQRINADSMTSNKSVGLVYEKRWKLVEW